MKIGAAHSMIFPKAFNEMKGGLIMRGEICTYQKCSRCGGRFDRRHISATMTLLECPACGIQPTRFYIDIYKNGRHRISRDERGNLLSSVDMANALLADIRRRPEWDPSRYVKRFLQDYIFDQVVDAWLQDAWRKYKLGDYAYGTWELKQGYAERYFLPAWRAEDIRDISAYRVEQFRLGLNRAPVMVNNIMMQLRTLFQFARELELIKKLPQSRRIKVRRSPPEVLTLQDQQLIFDHLPRRHWPIFRFLTLTGCRVAMARALQWEDINWRDRCIVFQHNYSQRRFTDRLKNQRPLSFPLTIELEKLLKSLPRHLSGHVFINPSTTRPYGSSYGHILTRACDRAGVRRVALKNFARHSFAFNLLESGRATTRDVSYLMGHSSEQVTRDFYDNVRRARLQRMLDGPEAIDDKNQSKAD